MLGPRAKAVAGDGDQMTETKKISPGLKMALDFGPVLAFFLGYVLMKDRSFTWNGESYSGFVLVTAAFIPLLMLTTAIAWKVTGKLSKINLVTLVLVIVFGAMTIWFNDERFFKMKPTILYLLFAGVLGVGLLRGKSWLEPLMGEALPLASEGWLILTKRLCLFFLALAVANEVIWRGFSTETWVSFKTFGLTIAMFAFFMTQGRLFATYGLESEEEKAKKDSASR